MLHTKLFTAALVAATLWALPVVATAETAAGPAAAETIAKGLNLYHHGDYLAAEGAFTEALAADPTALAARYYLGYTHYRMGEFDKARADFESAYLVDPGFTPAAPGHRGN